VPRAHPITFIGDSEIHTTDVALLVGGSPDVGVARTAPVFAGFPSEKPTARPSPRHGS